MPIDRNGARRTTRRYRHAAFSDGRRANQVSYVQTTIRRLLYLFVGGNWRSRGSSSALRVWTATSRRRLLSQNDKTGAKPHDKGGNCHDRSPRRLTQRCRDSRDCRPVARPRGVVGRPGRRNATKLLESRLCAGAEILHHREPREVANYSGEVGNRIRHPRRLRRECAWLHTVGGWQQFLATPADVRSQIAVRRRRGWSHNGAITVRLDPKLVSIGKCFPTLRSARRFPKWFQNQPL